jgi:hypothetical protein
LSLTGCAFKQIARDKQQETRRIFFMSQDLNSKLKELNLQYGK